jgi:predicted transcriptional regulator
MYMEAYMDALKKTTILISPELHDRLSTLAAQHGSSMGALIREACRQVYGVTDRGAARAAVAELGAMSVDVDTVAAMKAAYVARRDPLG